jgi:membrane protein implicated in regulation of membrane protease activity
MRWLKSIAREVIGLFVDDGSFAAAILAWAALVALLLPHVTGRASWLGPTLFSGLALILIESVVRFARRRRK